MSLKRNAGRMVIVAGRRCGRTLNVPAGSDESFKWNTSNRGAKKWLTEKQW